jgi:uncharacterized protein (UPF0333 family)
MMQWRSARKGQSTLEYILLVAAVLVAIITAVVAAIRPGVENTAAAAKATMEAGANKIQTGLGL